MSQALLLDVRFASAPGGSTDSWFTPLELWREWDREFDFTLDPCAHLESPVSQAIGNGFTIEDDGLGRCWEGHRVFVNPPYSDIAPWVVKAEAEILSGCELVAMLVPANRTEQPWWAKHVETYRDGRRSTKATGFTLETRFLPRRFRFGFPGDPSGKGGNSPTFGCVLLVWRVAR